MKNVYLFFIGISFYVCAKAQFIENSFSSEVGTSFRIDKIFETDNKEIYVYAGVSEYTNGSIPIENIMNLGFSVLKLDSNLNIIQQFDFPGQKLKRTQLIDNTLFGLYYRESIVEPCNIDSDGNANKFSSKFGIQTIDLLTGAIIKDSLWFRLNQCGHEGVLETGIVDNKFWCFVSVENIISETSTVSESYVEVYDENLNLLETYQNNVQAGMNYNFNSYTFLEAQNQLCLAYENTITFYDSALVLQNTVHNNSLPSYNNYLSMTASNDNYFILAGRHAFYEPDDINFNNPYNVSEIAIYDLVGNLLKTEFYPNTNFLDVEINENNEIVAIDTKRRYFTDEIDKPIYVFRINTELEILGFKDYGSKYLHAKLELLEDNYFSLYGYLETESLYENHEENKGYILKSKIDDLDQRWTSIDGQENSIGVVIFPNPATNVLKFDLQNIYNTEYTVNIYNNLGELMLNDKLKTELSIVGLEKGLYFISVLSDEHEIIYVSKFIKK